jgi:phenylalanyl-tRNA synthetase beta chain
MGGARETRWGRPGAERLDFFDAKGAVESIAATLGVPLNFEAASHYGLLPGHTADVRSGKLPVGAIAQVHPQTARQFDIDEPVFLFELWMEDLARVLPERPPYSPPSRFPEVRQDLALLVPEVVAAGRMLELMRSHRSGNIRLSADVFDEYRGEGVPAGKKSLAVRIRYQAPDRTLTDEDVSKLQSGLLKRLEKEFGAALRGA